MLMSGLDGQMMTARRSGSASAAISSRCGRAVSAPANDDPAHGRPALAAHEVVLEIEPAVIGVEARAHCVVRHRQDAHGDAEPLRVRSAVMADRLSPARQAPRALHMHSEIAVAELEPRLAAERLQRLHEGPGLIFAAPSRRRIVEARQRIHQGVDIG